MTLPLSLAAVLVGWSFLGNLLLGDTLYVTRNLLLLVAVLWFARRAGAVSWPQLGLDRAQVRSGARWGGAAVLVVAVVVAVGVGLADRVPGVGILLDDERANLPAAEVTWHALWRIPVGTALFEEAAFRAALLGLLLAVTSPVRAVVIASVVFGLWHVAPTVVALQVNDVALATAEGLGAIAGAVVVTTVAGVGFCLLRLASGSLLAPVLAHWATNSFGLLAAALTHRVGG